MQKKSIHELNFVLDFINYLNGRLETISLSFHMTLRERIKTNDKYIKEKQKISIGHQKTFS